MVPAANKTEGEQHTGKEDVRRSRLEAFEAMLRARVFREVLAKCAHCGGRTGMVAALTFQLSNLRSAHLAVVLRARGPPVSMRFCPWSSM